MPEQGTFRHRVKLTKWTPEQTAAAAERHGVSSDELTHEQMMAMDFDPDEEIEVDHAEDRVIYTNRDGDRHEFTIDEWNAEEAAKGEFFDG